MPARLVALIPGRRAVVAVTREGDVRVASYETGSQLAYLGLRPDTTSLAVSADGQFVALGRQDGGEVWKLNLPPAD